MNHQRHLQQAEPKFTDINPQDPVRDCIEDYALALQDREVTVDVTVETISVDEELYRRILDNLVSNAVAHGAVGRPISVRIYQQEEVVAFLESGFWAGFYTKCMRSRCSIASLGY